MGKQKKKWQPWQLVLAGSGMSLGLYGSLILVLAYAVIADILPEAAAMVVMSLGACLSVMAGGLSFGQRLPVGVMGGCLGIFIGFWMALLALAWGCYGGVVWSSSGTSLICASLAGAILAGVIARKHKGRRIAKRFG